ncbi:MAG: efflux RND transporter permease subunit [Deltaproteobacteria bacterium]|nr:efflux RND transporter permease subunit [Deltaproteobacteria bacterium]
MTLWGFAVQRWQFTLVLFGLLIALGIASFRAIPRSEDPAIDIPISSVLVFYPGADALEVERVLVDPIEDALAELENMKKIQSVAGDGVAYVIFEFEYGYDVDREYDQVVREMNALASRLPAGVGGWKFSPANPGLVNLVQMAIVSETADWREMELRARQLEDLIETVPQVRNAETWAYPKSEVRVAVDIQRLARAGITHAQLSQAIAAENTSVPGGSVDVGPRRFNLRTSGSYRSLAEIEDTVVSAAGGRPVQVRDVAQVSWASEEERYLGRFSGERAVFVTANLQDNQNVFAARDAMYAKAAAWEKSLPPGIRLERGFDQSSNVASRLGRLGKDFVIAVAIVALTLLPLGLRAGAVVMISIPLSLALGVAALHFTGFSLNQLSISGLVLALGLLVDDSVVVIENIARWSRLGYSRVEAVIGATGQIYRAVLGCTATLLLAFLPLLFMPEAAGAFMRSLPAAVLFTVLGSLFIALTIIPFLARYMLRGPATPASSPRGMRLLRALVDRSDAMSERLLERLMGTIHAIYGPALRRALIWPRSTLLAALAVFALSLMSIPVIGFSLFPTADIPQFLIRVEAPDGASLAETDKALRFAEAELTRHPEVKHWFTNIGHGNPRIYYNTVTTKTQSNFGEMFVELKAFDPRRTPALLDEMRDRFAQYPAAHIRVKQFDTGPMLNAPVEVRITGPSLTTLRELAARVEALIETTEGTRDVSNPMRLQRIDVDLGIDTAKAALLGVPTAEADRTVRLAIAGVPAGKYRGSEGDEYDITLRLPMQGRQRIEALDEIEVPTLNGGTVPLAQIAAPHFTTMPNLIRRHNRQREVTLAAQTRSGFNTDRVAHEVFERLAAIQLPPGYALAMAGEAEAAEESYSGIGTAVLVGAFGILAVLVLEFGSFRSTLIVAGVVPLGITGALIALALTGYSLSFNAMVGMVALVGIEIKNSILLVDFTNQLRRQGVPVDEAIERAGETRFLPILLTSATAIGGMMPLAWQGSGLYSPLAIVIIGGLVSSTLLARLVTPVMYKVLPPAIEVAG